ncbi:metallophosphoesterase family protein [Spirosoma luteum]|uniref:metallophosphoesterase family protein n=1 Tax=Spirosoma luteum TaxID=431553 RepID=UPI000364C338|nr:metallophosphoesterase [Spirosoma luteum]
MMNRRTLLKSAGLLPLLTAPGLTIAAGTRKRNLRFAYVGDTHILPETKPMTGVAKCLHQVQQQRDKPAFILHGGDVIMDALKEDRAKVQQQWDAWHSVMKAENSLPVEYCIGNHDIWGFDNAKNDPLYGKKWAVDQMQISGRYRSFAKSGWHFIILDSVQPRPDGNWYTGGIDPEQLEWLKGELARIDAKTPILVMSHIPIVSVTAFAFPTNVKEGSWQIPGGIALPDAAQLITLFSKHPNVKACLSGHMHLLDQAVYNGVTYLCNGAVSGNWWKADTYQQTHAGYALFDLYDDGTVERTYLPYS